MGATSTDVKSTSDVCSSGKAVLHFWAAWSEPCKQMGAVLQELAKEYPSVTFQRVEAEEVDEVTIKYEVASVPTFVFLKDGALVDRLEGADAPALTQRTAAFASSQSSTTAPAAAAAKPSGGAAQQAMPGGAAAAANGGDVTGRIKYILSSNPVVLFMKGTPETPRCGFSGRVVEALRSVQAPLHTVDILQDDALRQGVKQYSDWPTYPQLYVKGELVGGCDIIQEMQTSGELRTLLQEKLGPNYAQTVSAAPAAAAPKAAAPAPPAAPAPTASEAGQSKEQVAERIKGLLASQPVMLFMKGVPEAPRCGFSRKVAGALQELGVEFGTFDILSDEAIRQGLKEYSNWPTYPQLYVKGELVGGCDIVLEMQAAGELKSAIDEMMYRMADTK